MDKSITILIVIFCGASSSNLNNTIYSTKCETEAGLKAEFLFHCSTQAPDNASFVCGEEFVIMTLIENGLRLTQSNFLIKHPFNIYADFDAKLPYALTLISIGVNKATGGIEINGHINGAEIVSQSEMKRVVLATQTQEGTRSKTNNKGSQHSSTVKTSPALRLLEVNNDPDLVVGVVEVLVIFDYANALYFNFDEEEIEFYVRVFYNSVNNRFRDIEGLKVTVLVTGIVVIDSYKAQSFMQLAYNETTDIYDGDQVIDELSFYAKKNKPDLPKHDVVQLISGETFFSDNFKIKGLAYVQGACLFDEFNYYGVSIVFDNYGSFKGVRSAAHELGHLIGANHDGEGNNCSSDEYIMASGGRSKDNFHFSNCSIDGMKSHIASEEGICLRSIQASSFYSYPSILPGDRWDLNMQCKLFLNRSDAFAEGLLLSLEQNFCTNINCRIIGYSYNQTKSEILDNSPCGFNKVCLKGECVEKSLQLAWQYPYVYFNRAITLNITLREASWLIAFITTILGIFT